MSHLAKIMTRLVSCLGLLCSTHTKAFVFCKSTIRIVDDFFYQFFSEGGAGGRGVKSLLVQCCCRQKYQDKECSNLSLIVQRGETFSKARGRNLFINGYTIRTSNMY